MKEDQKGVNRSHFSSAAKWSTLHSWLEEEEEEENDNNVQH